MRLSALFLPALLLATVAHAEVPGDDHPLLPRYPGAEIAAYRAPSIDRIIMPTGRIGNAKALSNAEVITGRLTHIDYVVRPGVATLQIAGYYKHVLEQEGFQTLFSCAGLKTCGAGMGELILNSGKVAPTGFADGLFGDRMRVMVARRGETWVLLHIYEGPDRSVIYEAVVEGEAGTPAGS